MRERSPMARARMTRLRMRYPPVTRRARLTARRLQEAMARQALMWWGASRMERLLALVVFFREPEQLIAHENRGPIRGHIDAGAPQDAVDDEAAERLVGEVVVKVTERGAEAAACRSGRFTLAFALEHPG